MATEEHLQLSSFIRKVHQELRGDSRNVGPEEAWENHCKKRDLLKEYSSCMYRLATDHWETTKLKDESRILWVVKQCQDYFFEGRCEQEVEKDLVLKLKLDIPDNVATSDEMSLSQNKSFSTLKLLDVGSCYNPFRKYTQFEVTAIDLAPATSDVLTCDFLKVDIRDEHSDTSQKFTGLEIAYLQSTSFEVVIFSLLLEYLPCPEQRLLCCEKAYQLLKTNGLLFIITPDSKHPSANARTMKRWKIALSLLGFRRVYYEKLTHLHCMAFRKCVYPSAIQKWGSRQIKILEEKDMSSDITLTIPQDSNFDDCYGDVIQSEGEERTVDENNKMCWLFSELPDFY